MKQGFVYKMFGILTIVVVFWPELSLAKDTELLYYRPFSKSDHHPAVTISAKRKGICRDQSHIIKREDAWRCYADGTMHDPCFVKRFGSNKEAVCLESPWSTTAIQIDLPTSVNNEDHLDLDMSRTYPWAVETLSNERCYSVDTEQVIDGLSVHYQCEDGAFLVGHLQRCSPVWSMLRYTKNGSGTVKLEKAWF